MIHAVSNVSYYKAVRIVYFCKLTNLFWSTWRREEVPAGLIELDKV